MVQGVLTVVQISPTEIRYLYHVVMEGNTKRGSRAHHESRAKVFAVATFVRAELPAALNPLTPREFEFVKTKLPAKTRLAKGDA